MYNISPNYIAAVKDSSHRRKIAGNVGGMTFDDENIVGGTLVIDNACSEGTEVKIGSVYMGQLQCVFCGINYTGQWYGKTITLAEGLLTGIIDDEEVWEWVPLGTFEIVEANHFEDGVHVTAYDRMQKFEKTFPELQTSGTPYDLLMLCCNECGVALKKTQEQIEELPNGNKSFVLFAENDIETYRDFVSWIAQTMGCFATMTRDGKLDIRMYGGTTVDTIGITERFRGASFSDFVTRYTGVSVVQIDKETTVYKGLEVDDGLTYNLGSNPLLQNIVLDEILGNILTALANIQYTPFSVDKAGNPAYDLGDQVEFPGGLGRGVTGCIMAYDYTYHGAYTIQGFGSNPALANAKSKTDKQIAGLMSRTNSQETQYYTFTNAGELVIGETDKEIIHIRFGSSKSTTSIFQAEILCDVESGEDTDTVIANVKYILNGNELLYKPVETWIDGDHLLHLLYFFPIDSAQINNLSVRMNAEGGTITIPAASIQACIYGQGLAATDKWDGYIEAEDNIVEVGFGTAGQRVDAITGEVTTNLQTPIVLEFSERITEVEFATTPDIVMPFGADVYINKYPLREKTWGEVNDMTWEEDGIYDETTLKHYGW